MQRLKALELQRRTEHWAMSLMRTLQASCLGASVVVATAGAGPVLETKSLRYTLPDGWVADLTSRSVSAKGPQGELLQVTVSSLAGQGTEARAFVRNVEERALAAMRAAERESGFRTTRPLASERLPNGANFHQLVSTSSDGKKVLAQFLIVSPRAVVLATLDLPSAATSSIETVSHSLRRIESTP
jgi:hypothetical protein